MPVHCISLQPAHNCGSHIFDGVLPPLSIHTHGCLTVIQTRLEHDLTLILDLVMGLQVVMMLTALLSLVVSVR